MYYTKSINLNPKSHIVYTNRATAFKRHGEYQLMFDDSQKAIDLDPNYFKAYFRHGEACIELGKLAKYQNLKLIDEGIKYL